MFCEACWLGASFILQYGCDVTLPGQLCLLLHGYVEYMRECKIDLELKGGVVLRQQSGIHEDVALVDVKSRMYLHQAFGTLQGCRAGVGAKSAGVRRLFTAGSCGDVAGRSDKLQRRKYSRQRGEWGYGKFYAH